MGQKVEISKGSAYDEILSDSYKLAEYYSEKIESLTLLGNVNKKVSEVDKRVEELEIRNKGLEQTLEELKADKIEIKKEIVGLKTDLEEWNMIKGDVKTFLDWIKDKNKNKKLTKEELDLLDEL